MDIFLIVLSKLAPLYVLILLGFIGKKFLKIEGDAINKILIYFVFPVVIFDGIYSAQITKEYIAFPIFIFVLQCLVAFIALKVASLKWKDSTKNMIAFNAGTGNMGYLGLPIALTLLDKAGSSIYAVVIPAVLLYQFSYGLYIMAQGAYSAKESIKKILNLPLIYAFILGIIVNILSIDLGPMYESFVPNMKGAFVILGMMSIGLYLPIQKMSNIDFSFIDWNIIIKFFVWPLLAFIFIWLDQNFIHFFSEPAYKAMIIYSIVPMATNGIVLAAEFKAKPEQVATAVLVTTIISMVFIPIVAMLFL